MVTFILIPMLIKYWLNIKNDWNWLNQSKHILGLNINETSTYSSDVQKFINKLFCYLHSADVGSRTVEMFYYIRYIHYILINRNN